MTTRPALHPLAGFTLHASIDRIVFEVRFQQPSQFAHVRNRMLCAGLGGQFVHEIDPHTYRTTIQNPTGPESFMRAVQALAPPTQAAPITETDIAIVEVETAIDAKPIGAFDDAVLAGAVLHFVRHHANPPEPFRVVRPRKIGNTRPQAMGLASALRDGANTIFAGPYVDAVRAGAWNTDSRVFSLRAYAKVQDTTPGENAYEHLPKNAYEHLPKKQHRARIESIHNGAACPFHTVGEWRSFRFETLIPCFWQVRLSTKSVALKLMLDWLGSLGEQLNVKGRAQHRRNSRIGTARDSYLNKRIARALTALTVKNAEICTPQTPQE